MQRSHPVAAETMSRKFGSWPNCANQTSNHQTRGKQAQIHDQVIQLQQWRMAARRVQASQDSTQSEIPVDAPAKSALKTPGFEPFQGEYSRRSTRLPVSSRSKSRASPPWHPCIVQERNRTVDDHARNCLEIAKIAASVGSHASTCRDIGFTDRFRQQTEVGGNIGKDCRATRCGSNCHCHRRASPPRIRQA